MRNRLNRRVAVAASAGIGVTLLLAACGADAIESGGDASGDPDAGVDTATEIDCAPYEEFGEIDGTTVSLYTSILAPEDQPYIDAFQPFTECTGVTVNYEGSAEFEAQLLVRVQGGNPPDIALFPQPGLLQTIVRDTGTVVPAPDQVEAAVDEFYGPDWKAYGTVDDEFYAAPNSANVKSFVWYSPSAFEENGYEVPETWDDMLALSDQIVADNPGGEIKPWCAGIGSGDATGWTATDWMEDVMLRTAGADVYDQWTNHEIPFNDPAVATALETVGGILKNEDYVNGGIGGVQSIASTTFQDGGLPVLDGSCFMHRQASFYAANWPEGTNVAEDGDVFAFYLPPIEEEAGEPILGAGEFVGAFDDRPEVQAFQLYMTSSDFINLRAQGGQFIPPHSELDTGNLTNPIDTLSAELLTSEDTTFRFDASDLMPGAVGAGSFWTEMTAWIAEDKADADVLDAIEASWPQ
ncbi:ABC transporter substrate-binding protein [Aquipuribacter sp. MA13-6]|uniref:ABC transporter substrate-binding protein n=1 Tax=unclassified Aquipuribacter TaxID=2635084 RepID=UPI003EE8B713